MSILLRSLLLLAALGPVSVGCSSAPAGHETPKLQTLTQVYGPYDLEGGGLMQMFDTEIYAVDEPLYVLRYLTQIVDGSGEAMPDNFHCHTTFRTQVPRDWWGFSQAQKTIDAIPFKGLFSDGHTTGLEMPEGFGVHFGAGEGIRMMPMFNNRSSDALTASMYATVQYAPEAEAPDLRPLFSTSINVTYPHLYMVPPGVTAREAPFEFWYEGRIHLMAVHIHPYGKSVELIDDTRGETVWKSVGNRNPDGTLIDMPVYSNVRGRAVRPGEKYRIRVTYDNPTDEEQDAMGGLFVFFSTEDDRMPEAPPGFASADATEPEDPACHEE